MPPSRTFVTAQHWGVGVAEVAGGRLQRVQPHPDDPDPSPIHQNLVGSLAGSVRVARPAVRKRWLEARSRGDSSQVVDGRGEDPFVEVGWDEALDLIAGELKRVYQGHGSQAVYGGSYGWASAGRLHHAQSQLKRFLAAAGGFVSSEGNYSYHAALKLMPHILGNYREHVKAATRWSTIASDGELVVMFGGVALRNAQVSGGGITRHTLRQQLEDCAKSGVRFVNLSPLRDDVMSSLEAEWLAPRPGSDTAVMLALAHTLFAEDLHDASFLERYTVGFDKVAAYLTGQADGVVKDAEWASKLSGLEAERLRALARQMASKRTLLCTAVSLQRAEYGEQPLWMTVTLAAMLGQIGLPGGGFGIGYAADAAIGTVDRPMPWPAFPPLHNPQRAVVPVAVVADMLLNPGAAYAYNGSTRHYPDIRLVWWAGGNPFHHHQDLNRLRKAFARPETVIVNEINWTATARHADIVLPVASTLERTDFGAGTQDRAVVPMPRAVLPHREAREEYEIYCALERRLGLGQAFSEGRSADDWLAHMWATMRSTAETHGVQLPDLTTFLQGDVCTFADPHEQAVFLAAFRADPSAEPLPTPSGRIELYSEKIASFGYDDCPGQATWLAPREWLGSPLARQFPLHLLSGQPQARLHSQFDNGALSQSQKVAGREPVLINPVDAAARGVGDGDIVELFNARGCCLAGAVVTAAIRASVVFLRTGAWFDPDFTHPVHRDRHGNPNVLTHDRRTSKLSQGPASHSALVEMRRFEGEPPPVMAFQAPV